MRRPSTSKSSWSSNQASTAEKRNAAYARIAAFDRYRRGHKLEMAHAAYHSSWYLPAIRELISSRAFEEDPERLAALLLPPIKPNEAKFALDTLLELGMIERDPHGRLRQTSAVVSTGPETLGLHITNYHAEMMRRATSAMELVPAAQRDISSVTFCVGASGLGQVKKRIQEFRRELIALVEAEGDRTQVVQLNLQLFPLTKPAAASKAAGSKSPEEDRHG